MGLEKGWGWVNPKFDFEILIKKMKVNFFHLVFEILIKKINYLRFRIFKLKKYFI